MKKLLLTVVLMCSLVAMSGCSEKNGNSMQNVTNNEINEVFVKEINDNTNLYYKDEKYILTDNGKNVLKEFDYDYVSFGTINAKFENYMFAMKDGKVGVVDLDGNVIVPFNFVPVRETTVMGGVTDDSLGSIINCNGKYVFMLNKKTEKSEVELEYDLCNRHGYKKYLNVYDKVMYNFYNENGEKLFEADSEEYTFGTDRKSIILYSKKYDKTILIAPDFIKEFDEYIYFGESWDSVEDGSTFNAFTGMHIKTFNEDARAGICKYYGIDKNFNIKEYSQIFVVEYSDCERTFRIALSDDCYLCKDEDSYYLRNTKTDENMKEYLNILIVTYKLNTTISYPEAYLCLADDGSYDIIDAFSMMNVNEYMEYDAETTSIKCIKEWQSPNQMALGFSPNYIYEIKAFF